MTSERLYEILGNISEDQIDDARTPKAKASGSARIKWGTAAACLCLAIAALFVLIPDRDTVSPTVISHYECGKSSNSSIHSTPSPGNCLYFPEVTSAREHYYGEDVSFLLAIDIFNASDEEAAEEYRRLTRLGYRLYEAERWTYRGDDEKEYATVTVGLFTEDELSGFKANENYGYAFHFVSNGDGSAISVDEDDRIIDSGHISSGTAMWVAN